VERLKTRSAFRAVASGRRISSPGFTLQALRTGRQEARPPRFGFTVTKKTGNAVVRNRIRRRLKEAVRLAGVENGKDNTDYVLVGRRAALSLEFERLVTDAALAQLVEPQDCRWMGGEVLCPGGGTGRFGRGVRFRCGC